MTRDVLIIDAKAYAKALLLKTRSLYYELKTLVLRHLRTKVFLIFLVVEVIAYGITFSYFTIAKHNAFQSYAWDLGGFNQAFYTTMYHGKPFYYTLDLFQNPTGSYFATHMSPILFVLLPFYAVCPSPTTLLVMKSFILAFGAIPLFMLAKHLLNSEKAAFFFGTIYLLYPPLQGANWFDFQQQAILPLLFFSQYYFITKNEWKGYFITMLLTLTVEEHVVFAVFVLATYQFIKAGKFERICRTKGFLKIDASSASLITMIICVVYYVVAVIWAKSFFPINPEYMQRYKATSAFSILGVKEDPLFFPIYVFSNPQQAFDALMYDYSLKFFYVILLFAPLCSSRSEAKYPFVLSRFYQCFFFQTIDLTTWLVPIMHFT